MRCTSPLYVVNQGGNLPPFLARRKIIGLHDYNHYVNNLAISEHNFTRVNCGQCLACRINKSREWAERCYLEAKLYDSSYFLTLTYSDEFLSFSESGFPTLQKRDLQLFWKRLRKWCSKEGKPSPRYFACGEYGDSTFRPHYHAILFNFSLDDLVPYKTVKRGNDVYIYQNSPTLEKLWGKGFVVIAKVCPETCVYTAQYSLKKVGMKYNKVYAEEVLSNPNSTTSERFNALCFNGSIQAPFHVQSNRNGIAGDFCLNNADEILQTDSIPGAKVKNIRYFDKLLERINSERVAELKEERVSRCLLDERRVYDLIKQYEVNAENLKARKTKKRGL